MSKVREVKQQRLKEYFMRILKILNDRYTHRQRRKRIHFKKLKTRKIEIESISKTNDTHDAFRKSRVRDKQTIFRVNNRIKIVITN